MAVERPNGISRYSVVTYNEDTVEETNCAHVAEALSKVKPGRVTWITLRDVHDEDEIRALLDHFHLDPFLLTEILDETPMQFETEYENCIYLEYVIPYLNGDADLIGGSKGSFILGRDFLLLYEHNVHGLFSRTRRRIAARQTRVQRSGPDYLLYLLLRAAIVEHYQLTFKRLTQKFEDLEDIVLASEGEEGVYDYILAARETLKPWNEPLLEIQDFLEFVKDAESKFITQENARHFTKDLTREVEDLLAYYDRLHSWMKEMLDLHMANVQVRANRVMQVLTVVATIFLPLTFVSSIYGMNFQNMPELRHPWGYPAALLLMATIAIGSLVYMRRRRWI